MLKLRDFATRKKLSSMNGIELTPYEKRSLTKSRSDTDVYLYDELVRVPLMFAGYGVPKNKIITQQVGSIDIFPTVVDIIEITNENKTDGISLKPAFSDKNIERSIYMESGINTEKPSEGIVGIRTSKYKYFRDATDINKKVHLYNLMNDPLEENNIANTFQVTVDEMEQLLNSNMKTIVEKETNELSADEMKEIESELKKLGYI